MKRWPFLVAVLFCGFGQELPAQVGSPAVPERFDINDWTPRVPQGKTEAWERMRDADWVDGRFRKMDTGPALNATFKVGTEPIYKGVGLHLGDQAGAIFDRVTLRLAASWSGGYLQHSDKRFGLLNTPTPATGAKLLSQLPVQAGWANAKGEWKLAGSPTRPEAAPHLKFLGHYLHNSQVVLHYSVQGTEVYDTCRAIEQNGSVGILRTLLVQPHDQPLAIRWDSERVSQLPADTQARRYFLTYGKVKAEDGDNIQAMLQPGGKRWGEELKTPLVRGNETEPFAVDTLTLPYANPFQSLFFCTGVDFLPDGRVAMCTCHGDVWLARVDETASLVYWQRYATGLYHPLGLKVVDGQIVVLERGQLTRLQDRNQDGEADYYECLSNNWDTGSGEHSYDTCLETDANGNFYFFKTGDTQLPTGGCLMRVSKDGRKTEVFATGFRHPIGMGMNGEGTFLSGADQEGNWMPATRIDRYKQVGFYGDMRAAHRNPLPTTYEEPICWLPREVDNSAGGQVWVPKQVFGELAGLPMHLSYGRCRAYLLLVGERSGGVAPLPLTFLSGSCRGRFHPRDGHLYVCGLNGWQTAAKADGSLQRVRRTSQPLATVVAQDVRAGELILTFNQPLPAQEAENPANYKAARWNYIWSKEYGSKRWKVSNPKEEGQDTLTVATVRQVNERTVALKIAEGVGPVMQMQVGYNLKSTTGLPVTGAVYLTIHPEADQPENKANPTKK